PSLRLPYTAVMLKLWVVLGCLVLTSCQQREFDYVYDYVDTPSFQPQPQAARQPPPPPPPPPPSHQLARDRRPPPPPPQVRPQFQSVQDARQLLGDSSTTPISILRDSRRIDTKTGAFVYEYAGADGSSKYEVRLPNGTVTGNYTFINDLGEKETRFYSAGVHDPTLVDETTDPSYIDQGNYDLYRHLERPYVHNDGTFALDEQAFSRSPSQAQRPRAQSPQPRRPSPQQRPSGPPPQQLSHPPQQLQPRPPQQPPPRPPQSLPPPVQQSSQFPEQPEVPLDFGDASSHFSQPPLIRPQTFEDPGPQQQFQSPPQAPLGPVGPVPSRVRPSGRPSGRQQQHRLDLSSSQNVGSFLDSVIQRFQ
ncbi:hypothetical protein OTU49_015028, partial [Cherax quadricarinatus]